MIFFDNIHNLSKYFDYISKKLNQKDIFFVGGVIRDILLGVEKTPKDIDITCGGTPNQIFSQIDKKDISIFKTDKFGTITIIPKQPDKIKYEITPFRTEGQYGDFRHPSQITRSNDIILDSFRRDFTINCIYYYNLKNIDFQAINNKQAENIKNSEGLLKILEKDGYVFIANKKILILQNHQIIKDIFKDAKLDIEFLKVFLSKLPKYNYGDEDVFYDGLGILIDPNGGIFDIINKKIKAVGDPDKRFSEDALRVVRGLRFVNILNQKLEKLEKDYIKKNKIKLDNMLKSPINFFDFETQTRRSLKKHYYLVKYVAKERLKDEIIKVFKADNPFGFVALLDEVNLLKTIFPAVYMCKKVDQPIRYHPFDVYAHTMLVFYNIQNINKNYLVKLGALYHDVGKPDQYSYVQIGLSKEERQQMHSLDIHHPVYGVDIAKNDLKQLGFSKKEIEEVCFYIRYHMVPGEILGVNQENLENKLIKLLSQFGYKRLNNLFDICIADRLGQFNPLQKNNIQGVRYLKKKLKTIYKTKGKFDLKSLAVNGNDVMDFFKISSGPQVGKILNDTFNWVIEDIQNRNTRQMIFGYWKQKYYKN